MDTTSLIWLVAILIAAAAIGVGTWLYADYRAGQQQKRVARSRQELPLPQPRLSLPPAPPPPSFAPEWDRPKAMDPRIEFGPTQDLGSWPSPMPTASPDPGSRDCPVCRHPIARDDYPADRVIICPECRTHVHTACWEYASNHCPNCGH